MHGYKKPKNEWQKKKSKKNKFRNYDDEFGYEEKKDYKKNKRYHRVKDGYVDEENYDL